MAPGHAMAPSNPCPLAMGMGIMGQQFTPSWQPHLPASLDSVGVCKYLLIAAL